MHNLRYSLLLTVLVACSSRKAETPHSFRIYKEHGITIAETTGGPKYEGELFSYERILEIKEDPERPESFMKNVVSPHYGPDANYYLLDMNGSQVTIFSSDGQYLRSIGRPGDGPGELRYPTHLSFNGGTINVGQTHPLRLTRFGLDGVLKDVITRSRSLLSRMSPRIDVTEDEKVLLVYYEDQRGERFNSQRAGAIISTSEGDTVASITTPWVLSEEMVSMDLGQGTRSMPVRINYSGRPLIDYATQHGLVKSTGLTPDLFCYDLSGNLKKRIRIDLTPEPVTENDRDALWAEYDRVIARREAEAPGQEGLSTSRTKTFQKNSRFAGVKPFWMAIRVDEAGWFWLLLPRHEVVDYEGVFTRSYRVLNSEGEYVGDTILPPGLMTSVFHDRVIKEEEHPETGERVWAVYKIIPAVNGLKFP